jgi:hypothetical protein
MDGSGFDRIVRALAASSARRQALRATVVGLFAAAMAQVSEDSAAHDKLKNCKKIRDNDKKKQCIKKAKKHNLQHTSETTSPPPPLPLPPQLPPPIPTSDTGCASATASCDSTESCCGAEFQVVACREHLDTKDDCAAAFPGRRCCVLEGVICDPNQGNCGCCDDLVCTAFVDESFRCAPSEP